MSIRLPEYEEVEKDSNRRSPWGTNDPDVGSRTVLTDPWDPENSEFGWFSDGTTDYTDTRGSTYTHSLRR